MKISKKRTVVKVFACILCIGIGTLSGIIPSIGAENVSDIEQINTFSPKNSQKADNEVQRDNGLTKSSKCDSCKRAHTPQIKHHSQQFYRKKTGKCYHKNGCPYLKHSKIKVSQNEICDAELKPCSKCF